MSTINTVIIAAFHTNDLADAANTTACARLQKLGPDKARIACLAAASEHYNVPLIAGSGKAEGQKVLDSEAAKYETARKRVQRLLAAAFPKGAKQEVEIPKELLKAAQVLAKLAGEYEGSRSLAAKALAAAFAK